jgi:hypothetical protein
MGVEKAKNPSFDQVRIMTSPSSERTNSKMSNKFKKNTSVNSSPSK